LADPGGNFCRSVVAVPLFFPAAVSMTPVVGLQMPVVEPFCRRDEKVD
jgi:hypothetical protein